ncbi:MAG: hypothetical protein ACR2HN_11830 [Tepidiformaceae bacterium]
MINPVLTILLDVFLIGSAIAIAAAMVAEYRSGQWPAVGSRPRSKQPAPQQPAPSRITRYHAAKRSAAPRRWVA